MKIFIVMLLCAVASGLSAQDHYVGLKGAIGITKVTEPIFDNKFIATPSYGITYEYQFNPKISITAEALISQRGFRNEITETSINGQPIRNIFIDERFNYFSVPLKFGYTINQNSKLYVKAGLAPSFLMSKKSIVSGSDDPIYNTLFNTVTFKDVNIFGLLEVGVNLKSFENSALYSSLGAFYGFSKFYDVVAITPPNGPRHFGFDMSVGYKMML